MEDAVALVGACILGMSDRFWPKADCQISAFAQIERPLYPGDLNRSTQHLHSSTGEGDVENETKTENLLQRK